MTAESLVFALLQILTRPEEGSPVVLRDSEVLWGDRRFPLAGGGAPTPAKTAYLLRRVGLEGIPLERLEEAWSLLLAEEHPRTAGELLAAVRRPEGSVAEEDEIPRRWRAVVEPLLRQIPAAAGAVEVFGPETPPADFALRLELRPLLETWPRRLLHDPRWATAEAPLPNMNPLPLDEVWVDLQMLDPGEWPVLAGLESLRGLLDQRYEERRWHSEPLALVLERISGIAAFIGPPGSGKTTLLKWIARRLIEEADSRYVLPLFVPLRRYVLWRLKGGEPGLLRFALQECGVQRPEQRGLWVQILTEMAGTWPERILVLLDGWDEVPVEEREALLLELRDLAYGFSVLVTSRPAAFPARLAASRVYEVADLAPDGIDALIRRWFRGAGEPAHAEALLLHLDRHPDLRRLARNPFLLTLLCGISRESHRRQGLDLPSTRAALYEQTMRLIYAHHAERYPEAPVSPGRRRQIERLALWLLDEAPNAPRFVFGPQDVIDSGGDPDLLPQVLKPARLLGQLGTDDDTLHFLHATFQEYLAAEALEQEPGQAVQKLRAHAHDATWHEVFHFLAAQPGPLRDAFWREMAAQAARPDRFGLVAARLARWVSAAGARDGGVALLGCDLRELLWPLIERITASGIWVEAYSDLDAAGFVRRVDEAIRKVDPRLRARLQRALTRIRNPAASRSLVEQILGADPHKAAVAAAQLRLRIDRAGLNRLREAAGDSQRSVAVRQQAIQALGYARDISSVPLFLRIAGTGSDLAREVACALGRIGGQDATAGLVALLDRSDSDLQRSVVRALGDVRDAPARDVLLDEIARRPEDDPLLVPILDALAEIPIHLGAGLIVDLLASETPETRRAAAWALAEATGPGVSKGLVAAAEDSEEEVRRAALEVFQSRARPDDAGWLAACIADPDRSSGEQGFALRALLTAAGRYAGTPEGQWLPGIAAEQVLLALRDPEGGLALEAVAHAHYAGPSVGPRLVEICLDEEASPGVRELACAALGKMEYRGAADALLRLVRAAPDADDDEDQTLETEDHRMARAAAEALTRIDAGLLLRESGSSAFYALARFAVETGCLVYDDHIVGPDGREWARALSLSPPARPHTPRRSAPPRSGVSAVDLDIKVSVRTVEGSQVLRYALSSPSGAAPVTHQEVQSNPFTGSFDAYRDRVIQRLEKLQDRLHPHGSYLAGEEVEPEMKRLGHELYRQLFPVEMKWMYRQWRDKVRTIQISSAEWWIPWELVRPYDQDLHPVIDDDFLGARFEITRWLIGGTSPAAAVRIERMACVEAGESGGPRLPSAARERELLVDLARRRQIEDLSPAQATFPALTALLEQGGLGLLHFVGHGEFSREHPEDSRILLADGRSLAAGELEGPLLQKISADRPLVFFNACSTAQQGAALTSLSGWPDAWIGRAGAGAFVAPQWQVRDSLAYELARLFYLALERGRTLGKAARLARRWVRRKDRRHATWLAFAVYGHPNARVSFGSAGPSPANEKPIRHERVSPETKESETPSAPVSAAWAGPFMPEGPPVDFVERPELVKPVIEALLVRDPVSPVGLAAAFRGAGGYGKTTLARSVCHDPRIRRSFPDGILWVTLGEQPANLIGSVEDLIYTLSRQRPGFSSLETAAAALAALLEPLRALLVIDDVWSATHLRPFLRGGPHCARLVTTRDRTVLPAIANVVQVDAMQHEEALRLLTGGLPVEQRPALESLAGRLGHWPLLLRLVNGVLRDRCEQGQSLSGALLAVGAALDRHGLTAFDVADPEDRNRAVASTLAVSLDQLRPDARERFLDLAIFPEDVDAPFSALQKLWDDLAPVDVETLCVRLHQLSLLLKADLMQRSIRLHDVIRAFLHRQRMPKLPAVHRRFLAAGRRGIAGVWRDLPPDETYLWRHLSYHLEAAGLAEELATTVQDLAFLVTRVVLGDPHGAEVDLVRAERLAPDDATLRSLHAGFANAKHLLVPSTLADEISATLLSRLVAVSELRVLVAAAEERLVRPRLRARFPFPDSPDPALLRTLASFGGQVTASSLSADGTRVVTACEDGSVILWDVLLGAEVWTVQEAAETPEEDEDLPACDSYAALSADGSTLLAADAEGTVQVWDVTTRVELCRFEGNGRVFSAALSADGRRGACRWHSGRLLAFETVGGGIVLDVAVNPSSEGSCALSGGGNLLLATLETGLCLWKLGPGGSSTRWPVQGATATGCTLSADGTLALSGSGDGTARLWDTATGTELHRFDHGSEIHACALSARGELGVTVGRSEAVVLWDTQSGRRLRSLAGHFAGAYSCSVSADGHLVATGGGDLTAKLWRDPLVQEGSVPPFQTHLRDGAIDSAGRLLAGAGLDSTLRIWDLRTSEQIHCFQHPAAVSGCVLTPDGDRALSVADDGSARIWDLKTGGCVVLIDSGPPFLHCALNEQGSLFAAAERGGLLRVWDLHSQRETRSLDGGSSVPTRCRFSVEGRYLLLASRDGRVRLWDLTEESAPRIVARHADEANSCALSEDGQTIASASHDGTVRLWDAAGNEQWVLAEHAGPVRDCAFQPGGGLLASVSNDIGVGSTLKVWDPAKGLCLASLRVDGELGACGWFPRGDALFATGQYGGYVLDWRP